MTVSNEPDRGRPNRFRKGVGHSLGFSVGLRPTPTNLTYSISHTFPRLELKKRIWIIVVEMGGSHQK